MPKAVKKSDRLSLRLGRDEKRRLERAAGYSGRSITDFVLESALQRAGDIMTTHETITLDPDDWNRLVEALVSPPPSPTASLLKARANHRLWTKGA